MQGLIDSPTDLAPSGIGTQRAQTRRWPEGLRFVFYAVICTLAMLWLHTGEAGAAFTPLGNAGSGIATPTEAASATLGLVSCTGAGSCSAAGHEQRDGFATNAQALVTSETGGVWATATDVALPADARAGFQEFPPLTSLSCGAAGSCSAVGSYQLEAGGNQALVVSETGGAWGAGKAVTLPAGAATGFANDGLLSVSCPAAGSCVAVGSYETSSGHTEGLVVSESGGVWGTGAKLSAPAGAREDPSETIYAVSCAAVGSCSLVGTYVDTSNNEQLMAASETGGAWGSATKVALPPEAGADPRPFLGSLSCATAGSCAAVGDYEDSSEFTHAIVVSESAGVWSAASPVTPPAAFQTDLGSVSCAAAGSCTAVGSYENPSESAAMTVSESGGVWGAPSNVALPSDGIVGLGAPASLRSVSCAAVGSCSAAGTYTDALPTDGPASETAMVVSEVNGVWGTASKVVPPGTSAQPPSIESVSCAPESSCAGVGFYSDSVHSRPLVLGAASVLVPPPATPRPSTPATTPSSSPPATSGPAASPALAPVSGATISSAQITALLADALNPTGKGAKIAALLKKGFFASPFKSLEAGVATIGWYVVPPGAKLSKNTKAKSVLVASGGLAFSTARTGTIKIKITSAGRKLLKHAKALKLTSKGTFTPTGGRAISKTKVIVLKR